MIFGSLGDMVIKLSLGMYIYSIFAISIGIKYRDLKFIYSARLASYFGTFLLLLSTITLVLGFVNHDYSIQYVADHSSNTMPHIYTWIAFYSGNEGSLLFISTCLSILLFLFIQNKKLNDNSINFSHLFILIFQIFLLISTSVLANPFTEASNIVKDGQGINPLLLHFGMFVHPPVQMLGLTAVVVPFSIAIGSLCAKNENLNLNSLRVWALATWIILTIGLALGSWWAYTILGWGGYWAWDPVENSSLMPWLLMTAFIHSIMVQQKRNMFKGWNLFLIIFAFFMAQMGMFINRGGPVPSVHSFGSSSLGWTFLLFMFISTTFSFIFFIYRYRFLTSVNYVQSILSRESLILVQNVLFLSVAIITLMGTIYPVFTKSIEDEQIYVGREFYDLVNAPILLLIMIILSIAPFVPWKNANMSSYIKKKTIVFVIAVLLAILNSWIISGHYWVTISFVILYFSSIQIFIELYKISKASFNKFKNLKNVLDKFLNIIYSNLSRYGGLISHTGILLVMLGIAGTSFMGIEKDFALKPGESGTLKNYQFTYMKTDITQNFDHTNIKAIMQIEKNGKSLGQYTTSKSYYPKFDMNSTKAGILNFGLEDFYFSQSVISEDNSAVFEVKINPLVSLIWTGAFVVVVGAIISVLPVYKKNDKVKVK